MQLSKDPVAVSRKACSLQGRIRSMEGLVASENILVEGDDNSCAVKLANMMNKDSNGKMMSPESMDDLFEMFGNQKTCEKTLEEGLVLVQRTGRKAFPCTKGRSFGRGCIKDKVVDPRYKNCAVCNRFYGYRYGYMALF